MGIERPLVFPHNSLMNTPNSLHMPNPLELHLALTETELQSLWTPVPLARQQREEMVRIRLRPELPVDYTGPVELGDLRLAVSPWLWSQTELGTSSQTRALNNALTEARMTNKAGKLDDISSVVQWLAEQLKESPQSWELFPSAPEFWEDCGTLKLMADTAFGTFIPLDLDLMAVYFFPSPGQGINLQLVVAQVWHDTGEQMEWGPTAIYTCSQLIADTTTNPLDWLFTSDTLVLKDPMTGKQVKLMPSSLDETDEGEELEEEEVDSEEDEEYENEDEEDEESEDLEEDESEDLVGVKPAFAEVTDSLLTEDPASIWIPGPFHHKDGRLYLTSTATQALSLKLQLLSEQTGD